MKSFKSIFLPTLFVFSILVMSNTFYACNPDDCEDEEIPCDTCITVLKPNIYIYPEEDISLKVWLDFPKGGKVTVSIPTYEDGWEVSVNTEGMIDNNYGYLFYEAEHPDFCQTEKGWCIAKDSLPQFFNSNLSEYGFKGREIDDFLDFWLPRFSTANYYVVYPQTTEIVNKMTTLHLSETPDNILRFLYLVAESNDLIELDAPAIPSFKREGFFVTEWGVVLE